MVDLERGGKIKGKRKRKIEDVFSSVMLSLIPELSTRYVCVGTGGGRRRGGCTEHTSVWRARKEEGRKIHTYACEMMPIQG